MSSEAFKAYLAELSADYCKALPAKLSEIEEAWAELKDGTRPAAGLAELQRLLHSIAGSAQTFGLPAVSRAAKEAESFVEPFAMQKSLPPAESHQQLDEFLRILAAVSPKEG